MLHPDFLQKSVGSAKFGAKQLKPEFYARIITLFSQQSTSFKELSEKNPDHCFLTWFKDNAPRSKENQLSLLEITHVNQLLEFENFDHFISLGNTLTYDNEPLSLLSIVVILWGKDKSTQLPNDIQLFLNNADFSTENPKLLYTVFSTDFIPKMRYTRKITRCSEDKRNYKAI